MSLVRFGLTSENYTGLTSALGGGLVQDVLSKTDIGPIHLDRPSEVGLPLLDNRVSSGLVSWALSYAACGNPKCKIRNPVTAGYTGSSWDDSDPSVFKMSIDLQGEYQITNGCGPNRAPQVLRDHWNSYITDADFSFLSSHGINAVRIPVGWWIAKDPNPPKPFVGGSLQALDNAFTWAQKYGMKVVVDLHAVQGSQNGNDHSGTRDGFQEWGNSYIPDTVAVIDFLAASLKLFYKRGYDAVMKYTSSAYVIFSNRLGPANPKELLSFANTGFNLVVIDVHYYCLFSDSFNNMNVQQNIDFIYGQRASDLGAVTTSNCPLTFVGKSLLLSVSYIGKGNGLVNHEWAVQGASKEDYKRFTKAQLDVYGKATSGWAYWAYKCEQNHRSLKWMIENGYIQL
ncbi:hypothetical protein Dsin_016748 [Dipteronia sinensis]|uniref:Glycoside hydrolase family 5 domain-containing protein n=1 Tax=Dipteronia sinensis TaxID=43782 RepID=A0AAE0AF17_9ROSI|nr:hypothetical protein Dsin_016748 [Dipteronia sinensis]